MYYLEFLLPPLLGATIGYLTNDLAIRMLFKPYKEWRVFGIKIPFTPGILPKNREELAHNIGQMVGKILLNEETLKSQVTSPHSHQVLEKLIHQKIDLWLDKDLPSLQQMIPNNLKDDFLFYYEHIKTSIADILSKFIKGQNFDLFIHQIVESNVDHLYTMTVTDLLNKTEGKDAIAKSILAWAKSINQDRSFIDRISEKLFELNISQKKLSDFLPYQTASLLSGLVEDEIPEIIDKLEHAVFESKLDQKLYTRFRRGIMDYLNSLTTFQKVVVNFWGVEERVEEDLPDVIHLAITQVFKNLKDDDSNTKITSAIRQFIQTFLDKDIASHLQSLKNAGLNMDMPNTLYLSGEAVSSPEVNPWEDLIQTILDQITELNINDISKGLGLQKERIVEGIVQYVVKKLKDEVSISQIIALILSKLDDFVLTKPIGKLNGYLSIEQSHKERISNELTKLILNALEANISHVVEAVNVEKTVIDKINQFPLDQVEDLLLLVVKKHLKWINVFGALLGLLIGSIQLLMNFLK